MNEKILVDIKSFEQTSMKDLKAPQSCYSEMPLQSTIFKPKERFVKWRQSSKQKRYKESGSISSREEEAREEEMAAATVTTTVLEKQASVDKQKDRRNTNSSEEMFKSSNRYQRRGIVFSQSVDQLENTIIEPASIDRVSHVSSFRLYCAR